MAITLAQVRTKITETEAAITKVKTAQGYSISDKSVQRARLTELTEELAGLRRDERMLEAIDAGATTGILTAKWS
ncbi:MAG: hypothetical protein EX270_11120 [Pseudomonadales bacterium]|nr:MAG: hypothetical protein EX270_11120 [Pseudomonadales bacterium]